MRMQMISAIRKTVTKRIKRAAVACMALCLALGCMACGSGKEGASAKGTEAGSVAGGKSDGKLRIVTTIFPEYDWVREILGQNPAGAELTLLLDSGTDLHSYQPTAEDIMRVSSCDLFIYVGGESDKWVADALKESTNPNMVVINLMEVLGDSAREEELVEGMQESDHDHDHEHEDADHDDGHEDADHEEEHEDADHDEKHEDADHDDDHDYQEAPEYDEHVWLSLKNTKRFVDVITEKLAALDTANAETYKANAKTYGDALNKLDEDYTAFFANAKQKTLLFGDRFPFRYMIEDYKLNYYAAFVGCSAETEASFETITFLSGKVDELGLKSIYVLEGSDQKIAETVRNNTKSKDQKIVKLNSMQGVTKTEIEGGAKYISLMQTNLEALKEAQ